MTGVLCSVLPKEKLTDEDGATSRGGGVSCYLSQQRQGHVRRILPAGCGQCDPEDTTSMAVGWPKSTRGT